MRGEKNNLVLSKLEVAARQLETAITLWFHDGEPVSTHALAFSANKVLRGICDHRQIEGPFMFDLKRIRKGKEKEYMRLIHDAPNFFKYADNDASDTIGFNPDGTEFFIFDAVETYTLLTSHTTQLITVFRLRFYLSYTHLWGTTQTPKVNKAFNVKMLRSLSRKEFFSYFDPRSSF